MQQKQETILWTDVRSNYLQIFTENQGLQQYCIQHSSPNKPLFKAYDKLSNTPAATTAQENLIHSELLFKIINN